MPQVCEGEFYLEALEKGLCREWALTLSVAQIYVAGVSTRKAAAIAKQRCGSGVFTSQISRATAQVDEKLAKWRRSPLDELIYLYLDARYEKVHQEGQIRDDAAEVRFHDLVSPGEYECEISGRDEK